MTLRSGAALSVTFTATVEPSATVYAACAKLTVTAGSSSSVMETVAPPVGPGAHPRGQRPEGELYALSVVVHPCPRSRGR